MEKVIDVNNIIETDERIIKDTVDLAPVIPMTSMGASSIGFQMRVWGKSADYWNLKFDLTEKIYQELTAAGIEIPFQQMDVHLIK
jgi:small conductance mechanosensitive channel